MEKEAATGRSKFVRDLIWGVLTTGSSAAKAAKTVFNPESYAPNFIGGVVMNLANGNFRYDHARRGLQLGLEELGALREAFPGAPTRDALRAELAELRRMGVVDEGVDASDLARAIEQSFFGKLGNRAVKVLRLPSRLYGGIDNFNKYVAYKSEEARYRRAYPQKTHAEVRRLAGETVRATLPTYSEIPSVIRQLSVVGIVPSFINFRWEMFRNTFNTARIGLRDMREGVATGNVALRNAGASRLAALTSVLAVSSGAGVALLSRQENKVTEEQEAAVRFFSGPWNREGLLQYHGPVARARAQFSNLSYLLPHAAVMEALEAARQKAGPVEAAQAWAGSMVRQFIGDSVLLPGLIGAVFKFDLRTMREIPKTAINPTLGDRADFLWEQAFEPLGVRWVEKLQRAMRGEKGDYGQEYSVREQLMRLAAVRSQTVDFDRAVEWKARDLGRQFADATGIFRSRMRQNLSAEKQAALYEIAEGQRQGVFEQLVRMRELARATGVKDDAIVKALRGAHLPPETILGVLDDRYVAGRRDGRRTAAEVFAEIQAKGVEERRAELAALFREDRQMAAAVLERIKDAGRGVTERDRLLLALGVGDGQRAAYLRARLAEVPVQERPRWLAELRAKRILTDRVLEQMAAPAGR